jgi:uncharacterized protein YbaR (Trm112 family)
MTCADHEHRMPISADGPPPHCTDCGKLLWTVACGECGERFLDYSREGSDDLMSAPHLTADGMLVCSGCRRMYRKEERRRRERQEHGCAFEHPYENRVVYEPPVAERPAATAGPADDADGSMAVPSEEPWRPPTLPSTLGGLWCFLWGHAGGAGSCRRCGSTPYTDDEWWPQVGERLRRWWRHDPETEDTLPF